MRTHSGVLTQGCRLLPGLGVQPHEKPMGGLVQGIQCKPAPGVLDRPFEVTLGLVGCRELSQGLGQRFPQAFGLKEEPFVEGEAIGE
jgi:hypothetical protein